MLNAIPLILEVTRICWMYEDHVSKGVQRSSMAMYKGLTGTSVCFGLTCIQIMIGGV